MPRIGASRSWAVARPPVTDRERKPGEGADSRQPQDPWPPADVQPFNYERKRAAGELRPSGPSEGTSAQPVAPDARASQAKTGARRPEVKLTKRKTTTFPASGGVPEAGNSP